MSIPRASSLAWILGASLVALACGSSASSTSPPPAAPAAPAVPDGKQLFSSAIKHVVIETAYVKGAEPYVGAQGSFADIWSVFRANVAAVFDGQKDVALPTTLAAMESLDDVAPGDMSNADLLALAASHRQTTTDVASGTEAYYVVFVDGFHRGDDGTVDQDAAGVSIGASGVIGIFKPAIAPYYDKKQAVGQLVEQLALVHQFGHAVGFVNNGVPIAEGNQAHQDVPNGPHCTNPQCAMNVGFESVKGIVAYVAKLPVSAQTVVYDQECLSDARILENQEAGN